MPYQQADLQLRRQRQVPALHPRHARALFELETGDVAGPEGFGHVIKQLAAAAEAVYIYIAAAAAAAAAAAVVVWYMLSYDVCLLMSVECWMHVLLYLTT